MIMTVFGDGAHKEVIKVKWGYNGDALIWWDLHPYETSTPITPHPTPSYVDSERRQMSMSQEESLPQKPKQPATSSWSLSLLNSEKQCLRQKPTENGKGRGLFQARATATALAKLWRVLWGLPISSEQREFLRNHWTEQLRGWKSG